MHSSNEIITSAQHNRLGLAALAGTLMIGGGCVSSQYGSDSQWQANDVALTVINPVSTYSLAELTPDCADGNNDAEALYQGSFVRATSPGMFHLGAGDMLGQAIFMNHVAIVRASSNWQIATGEK